MKTDYYTVKQFCQKNNLSEGSVRAWIFNGKENGFTKCIHRIGRKIIISQDDYYEWMSGEKVKEEVSQVDITNKTKLLKEYLLLNKSVLELSDDMMGKLFQENNRRSIDKQRGVTAGIIHALEVALDDDMDELNIGLEFLRDFLNNGKVHVYHSKKTAHENNK